MLIGVLALQGDFREHLATLAAINVAAIPVRTEAELNSVDGLIIPGGESTAISKLADNFGLTAHIRNRIKTGMPAFGTCAGLILLSDRIVDGIENQTSFGGLDVTVQRNAFGHQTESFETALQVKGIDRPVKAAFIRAPIVQQVGAGVEVLSELPSGQIVAVRQGNLIGISFHPEVMGESAIHQLFAELVAAAK